MAAYLIANYRITNPDEYAEYPPAVAPTLAPHGAEPLVVDFDSEPVEGDAQAVTIVLKFESREAARAWYESDEYRAIKHLRADNTEGFLLIADGVDAG
jgi:uncharacterized protein (DUF1330 family)